MKKTLILIIISGLLLTACQLTPKKIVVTRRNFEKLLEKNQWTEREEYPAELSDEFMSKDGKVKIIFDAELIAPDVDKFPVIQIDPQPITKELMQMIVDEFMGGETGYYPENYMTKSEIEERLLNYYAKLSNDELIKEQYEQNMPGVEIDYDAVKDAIHRRIADYTKMLEDAPKERENVPSNLNLRPSDFYTTQDHNDRNLELAMTQAQLDEREANLKEHLYLVSDKQLSGETIRLIVYNELPAKIDDMNDSGVHCMEYYGVQIVRARNDYLQLIGPPLCSENPTNTSSEGVENFDAPYPDLTISEEEAIQLAQQVFDDLGIDHFYLANSRIIKEYPSIEEIQNGYDREKKDDKFYLLTFRPEYYGIPFILANNRYSGQELVSPPFAFEEIKMKVSNDVIVEFSWSNPTDVSNVLNDNANLLSIDEIAEIAANHMKLKYNMLTIAPVWEESPTYEEDLAQLMGAEIKITKICLGLGGVQAYNAPGEYLLIPVWNFYGSCVIERQDDESDYPYEDLYIPFVSINAVDGSVIEQIPFVDLD